MPYTLIDTPGLASLSTASSRTLGFLSSDDERPTEADAVVYLLRHVHASDLRFLEAFHGDESCRGRRRTRWGCCLGRTRSGSAGSMP